MPKLSGMRGFLVIWLGQVISILSSGMTNFALSIWLYERTESATAMALVQVFYITPFLLMSIPAGVLVDRYSRKLMMAVSDLTAGAATLGVLVLFWLGRLEVWHIYVAAVFYGLGNTFQWPAYSAAISTMLPKEEYSRANGLMSLMEAGPGVLAPILAGALLPLLGIRGILLLDVVTFVLAVGALTLVHVPAPRRSAESAALGGNILKEAWGGFQYILERKPLLGLQVVFLFGNLFAGIAFAVMAPMILARTNTNALIFGTVQTAGAIGGVAGGVLMSVWKGFRRRVQGVLLGWTLVGIVEMMLLGVGRGALAWGIAVATGGLLGALMNASNQAIWQSKVAPDLQGRVFSARRLIAWFTQPISPLIGGLLADRWLEPAMRDAGSGLARTFGWLVGTGPGAGMGLLVVGCGLAVTVVALTAWGLPMVRNVETLLPDHDVATTP